MFIKQVFLITLISLNLNSPPGLNDHKCNILLGNLYVLYVVVLNQCTTLNIILKLMTDDMHSLCNVLFIYSMFHLPKDTY